MYSITVVYTPIEKRSGDSFTREEVWCCMVSKGIRTGRMDEDQFFYPEEHGYCVANITAGKVNYN